MKEEIEGWFGKLAECFPAKEEYSMDELLQAASDLHAYSEQLGANFEGLWKDASITDSDRDQLKIFTDSMELASTAIQALHELMNQSEATHLMVDMPYNHI